MPSTITKYFKPKDPMTNSELYENLANKTSKELAKEGLKFTMVTGTEHGDVMHYTYSKRNLDIAFDVGNRDIPITAKVDLKNPKDIRAKLSRLSGIELVAV